MNPKEYFDNSAATWDKRFHTPALCSFLEKIIHEFELKKGHNVLDVGTGTGILIPYLVNVIGLSGSVTAIDYSEKMIQICKNKYGHFKNVRIIKCNIQESSFQSESFDIVTCFGVFPHLENKQKSLQKINKNLKPNGKLVIFHALSSKELKACHKKISTDFAQVVIPERDRMKILLKTTGFTQISIRDEPGCYLCIAHKV